MSHSFLRRYKPDQVQGVVSKIGDLSAAIKQLPPVMGSDVHIGPPKRIGKYLNSTGAPVAGPDHASDLAGLLDITIWK